jgi:uncharacterized protein (DUF1697 family)
MANRYVALLRGINVGGRWIKNNDLQHCFEGMGFGDVRIVLQSGNVIFSAPKVSVEKLTATIEAGLQKRFNYPAKVVIVEIAQLQRAVDRYPFDSTLTDRQHYVLFLRHDVVAEMLKAAKPDRAIEQVAVGDKVIYWTVEKGKTLESAIGKFIAKPPYKELNTNRNINTLRKVLVLASQ